LRTATPTRRRNSCWMQKTYPRISRTSDRLAKRLGNVSSVFSRRKAFGEELGDSEDSCTDCNSGRRINPPPSSLPPIPYSLILNEAIGTHFAGHLSILHPKSSNPRAIPQAVDWWALGILIYEFLTGYPPFWNQNPIEIYKQ